MVGKADIVGLLERYKSLGAFRHSVSIVLRYLGSSPVSPVPGW